MREQQRAREFFLLHTRQRSLEIADLSRADLLVGDHPGILQGEIRHHFVGHLLLCGGAPRASTVARRMKYDLAIALDSRNGRSIPAEDLGQIQLRLGLTAARSGKRQRLDLMLRIQLVDDLVCRVIGGMGDLERRGIGRRLGLRKYGIRQMA